MKEARPILQAIRGWLETLSILLIVAVCGSLLWRLWVPSDRMTAGRKPKGAQTPLPIPKEDIVISDSPRKGTGQIVLVVFSDFQCPFCKKFEDVTWPEIDKRFVAPGKVSAVFKHMPLEAIHKDAMAAAEMAECANRQEKFWAIHDAFFAKDFILSRAGIWETARKVGLEQEALAHCLGTDASRRVRQDITDAQRLGVKGTPSFFIGLLGRDGVAVKISSRLEGAAPFERFETALQALERR